MRAIVRWLGCCVTAGALLSCTHPAQAGHPAADGGDRYTEAEHVQRADCIRRGVPLAGCVARAAGSDRAEARPTLPADANERPDSRPATGNKW